MFEGRLLAIFIAQAAGQSLQSIEQIHAVPGRGLEGDRYFSGLGHYSGQPGPHREVTLIESEALKALLEESNIDLPPDQTRRNLLTEGVPLNHLVGKHFQVGQVVLHGVRLCEPCSYLAKLTRPDVTPALVHRGGLRAEVINEGIIHVGDLITVV